MMRWLAVGNALFLVLCASIATWEPAVSGYCLSAALMSCGVTIAVIIEDTWGRK